MLKTALKPRWIAGLIFALLVASVFVLLSQWQLDRSGRDETVPDGHIEKAQPLTSTLKPGSFFPANVADQMVTFSGEYDPARQVLVKDRRLNGEVGFWVVTAFAVDGAPKAPGASSTPQTWIPVARGWVASAEDARPAPGGKLSLEGRLVPSDAPAPVQHRTPGILPSLSVAELINIWDVSSYQGYVGVNSELDPAGAQLATTDNDTMKPLRLKAATMDHGVNWLNIFYAVEWVVFAGFALFIWWRLVKDDYQRELEEQEDAALAAAGYFDAESATSTSEDRSVPSGPGKAGHEHD